MNDFLTRADYEAFAGNIDFPRMIVTTRCHAEALT